MTVGLGEELTLSYLRQKFKQDVNSALPRSVKELHEEVTITFFPTVTRLERSKKRKLGVALKRPG